VEAVARASPRRPLEVGPGPGTLTYWTAEILGVPVLGVDVDKRLVRAASREAPHPLVAYTHGDGVEHAASTGADTIVSNTPYNISSTLIAVAARNNRVTSMVLGVQKEVADRITAQPGTPDYGRLTLLATRYFTVEKVGFLPRSWFYPKPEVDGVILYMRRQRPWRRGDECFERLTACLFSARNKMAYKAAARCAGISPVEARGRLGDRRVRDLALRDVEWLVESGACTSGRD